MTITASGLGLFSRLIGSGLQRAGSLIFQKLVRVARIEQAIRSGYQRNASIKTALDDFETLIGNRFGNLTQQLDQFLQELERSGIINSMVENALLARESEPTKSAFSSLFQRVFDGSSDAEVLFDQMMLSFSITLRELATDRILIDALRLSTTDIGQRLDKIDRALSEIKPLGKKSTISYSKLEPNLLRLARTLQSTYKQIRVETNKGARQVDISRIYIAPKLRYRDTKKNTDLIANATRLLTKERTPPKGHAQISFGQDHSVPLVSYADLKQSFSKVIILGDPGGGKSTICQNICFDLAKQATAALLSDIKPSAQLQKFPFRIVLRAYEKARLIEPQLSILEYLARDLLNHVTLDKNEIRDCLSYLLTSGAAVLAFDGLDEILATAQRREFVDLVVSFSDQYPLCPTLVTSRLVGYDDARLTDDFEELVLEKFDDDEIQQYTTKFFRIVGGHDTQEATRLSNKFVNQTQENAQDLRSNPLMLGLMAWLFNARGDVPTNRPEIYAECAVLMFERWDPDRGIKPETPIHFDKLQLFTQLAAKIFGNPELSGGVERPWLDGEIKDYLALLYDTPNRAVAGARTLVDFITGRAWVMTDIGDGVYAFTHQTFLEYFFARHVNENTDTTDQVLDIIVPKIRNREWDVVSHLSLQMKTHRSLRRENEAFERLAKELTNDPSSAVAVFSSRALEYLVGSESNVRLLVSTLFQYVMENPDTDDAPAVLQFCVNCGPDRRDYVSDLIFQSTVDAFKNGQNTDFFESLLLGTYRHGFGQAVSDRIVSSLRPFVTERADSDAALARLAYSWYGLITRSSISKFSLWNFYDAEIRNGMTFIDGLSGLCLAASDAFHVHFASSAFTKKRAQVALAVIGAHGFTSLLEQRPIRSRDSGPPFDIWQKLVLDLAMSPRAQVGALLCFLIATSDYKERKDSETSGAERLKLVNQVLDVAKVKTPSIFALLKNTLIQMPEFTAHIQ